MTWPNQIRCFSRFPFKYFFIQIQFFLFKYNSNVSTAQYYYTLEGTWLLRC